MVERVRARFAPSPTGLLHIGNVHTALFTWLFVRHHNGDFVLRIEDTDRERSTDEYEQLILEDLSWLGLDWDEGVDIGGPYAPYRQTERMDIYREYAKLLLDQGWAYQCFCTPEELAADRAESTAQGGPPRYSGRCRNLTEAEREAFIASGRQPVLRFKTPKGEVVVVKDLLRGEISFNTDDLDDFVLVRSNGIPLYNFAVAIDDLTMKITHIVRADEHISNTPRQLLIYQALGAEPPEFAHVSMLLGPDRSKLSKRHGATSLREYKEKGYLPEAIFNYLATLGWSLPDNREIADREEFIRLFDLSRVSRSPAIYDPEKAAWMNGVYLRQANLADLSKLALPYLREAGLISDAEAVDRDWLQRVVDLGREGISCLSELPAAIELFFTSQPEYDQQAVAILSNDGVREILLRFRQSIAEWNDFNPEAIREAMKQVPREMGLGLGKAFKPLRVALTGKASGPELYHIISLFGREKVLARLDFVTENLLTE